MAHFSTPLLVRPLPEEDAIRISVRASENRIDEWTVFASDIEEVLAADEDAKDWRGTGELRVRLFPGGGDVAFYDGDDRVLIRLGAGEIASFLAHLHAAMYELPPVQGIRQKTRKVAAAPIIAVQPEAPRSGGNGNEVEALRGMMQQIMLAVVTLSSDVNKLMGRLIEREAERNAAPPPPPPAPPIVQIIQPQAPAAVIMTASVESDEPSIFIPDRVGTDFTGEGMAAKTVSSDGDDIAAAAAALKAAKKRRTKKKELE